MLLMFLRFLWPFKIQTLKKKKKLTYMFDYLLRILIRKLYEEFRIKFSRFRETKIIILSIFYEENTDISL